MRLIPDDTWAILTIWQETRNITFGTSNPSNLEPKQLVDHVRRDGAYLLLCDRPIGESTLTEVGQVLRVEVGAVVEGGEKEIEVGIHAHGRHGR